MSYRLGRGEDLTSAIRRIAGEQTARAVASARVRDPSRIEDAIHDVRKRCKKLRALVRFVRPAIGDVYTRANSRFRDASRQLSEHRDAHARLATFERLQRAHRDLTPPHGLGEVREWLSDEASRRTQELVEDHAPMLRATALIKDGLLDVGEVRVDDAFEPIASGVAKTHERARRRVEEVGQAPTLESFHQLRKRVKYARYHVHLLRPTASSILEHRRSNLHDLSDALGDAHDLADLATVVRDAPISSSEIEALTTLADGVRSELERRSIRLARRLFAERKDAYVDRLEVYFEAWRRTGPELDTGGIEVVAEQEGASAG